MPEGITKRKLVPVILPFGANPEKDPENKPKAAEKLHVRPAPAMPILRHGAAAKAAKVPVIKSPPESVSESPLSTPPSSPPSPSSPIVEPVAMGTVE